MEERYLLLQITEQLIFRFPWNEVSIIDRGSWVRGVYFQFAMGFSQLFH